MWSWHGLPRTGCRLAEEEAEQRRVSINYGMLGRIRNDADVVKGKLLDGMIIEDEDAAALSQRYRLSSLFQTKRPMRTKAASTPSSGSCSRVATGISISVLSMCPRA